MYCQICGKEVSDPKAENCPHCGAVLTKSGTDPLDSVTGGNSWILALVLCFCFGTLGIHRFYVRKNRSGIVMLIISFTIVGLVITWIWSLIDLVMILLRKFKTADGRDLI